MKTPVLESLFDKVAGLKACKFIKKRLQHKCSVKFAKSEDLDILMKQKASHWVVGLVLLNGSMHVLIINLKLKASKFKFSLIMIVK